METTEKKKGLGITTIFLLVIIIMLGSILTWNYYQSSQNISMLISESNELKNDNQFEINALKDKTELVLAESVEQKALIIAMQSKIGSIEDIEKQDRDYWLILQMEYLINLAHTELLLGRNNKRALDLVTQAKITSEGLEEKNQTLIIKINQLHTSIQNFIDENDVAVIREKLDIIDNLISEEVRVVGKFSLEQNSKLDAKGIVKWFRDTLENFNDNWSNIIVVKSQSNLDVTKLSKEEKRVIESLTSLNIELIRLALQAGNEPRYISAVMSLEEKLNRYHSSKFSGDNDIEETLGYLKKHKIYPPKNEIEDLLKLVKEMKIK